MIPRYGSERFALLFIGLISVGELTFAAEPVDSEAASMVRSALQLEAKGDAPYRQIVLGAALQSHGDYAPARWHSGYVRVGDDWLTLAEAESRASGDERIAGHQRMRDEVRREPLAIQHGKLGDWCAEHKLYDRARFHYHQLLTGRVGEQNREQVQKKLIGLAREADETNADKQRLVEIREATQAWQKWSHELKRLALELAEGNEARRSSAFAELSAISDPYAIPALEAIISAGGDEQALAVIELLAQMPDHAATLSLARHAVFCPSDDVREAATKQLVNRPLHDFAPWLLSGLASPVKARYWINSLPDGTLCYMHDFYREGANQNFVFRKEVNLSSGPTVVTVRRRTQKVTVRGESNGLPLDPFYVDDVHRAAAATEEAVDEQNERAQGINQRIDAVLSRATGQNLDADPIRWWNWWNQYNELQLPDEKPTVVSYGFSSLGQAGVRVQFTSCFAAGTVVSTETGAQPIETIRAGDRVLSQNADTGELNYQTVLATTIRPPAPLVVIRADGEKIRATRGHPFWVSGHGWKMAKFLTAGDNLHCANGLAVIESIGEVPPERSYNLVVDEFATYFVGDQRLLVHDNTMRKPTQAIVPGLSR